MSLETKRILRKAIGHAAEQSFTELDEFHLPLSCDAEFVSGEFEILRTPFEWIRRE